MARAVVAVGSNIDPEANVGRVRRILAERFRVVGESDWTWTDPIGRPEQDRYLNGAVLLETDLSAEGLQRGLRDIEAELGRVRTDDKYAPRTMDLDVVVYDGRAIDDDVRTREFLAAAVEQLLGGIPPGSEAGDGGTGGQEPSCD